MALTLVTMLFVSGVFAQNITLVIKNADGSASNGAVLYTLASYNGAQTTVATDGGASDNDATVNGTIVLNGLPAGNYTYLIKNAAGTNHGNFSVAYNGTDNITRTIALNTVFNPAIANYVALRTGDTITVNKAMPFWVYPSVVYNPSYTAPTNSGNYTPITNIVTTNVLSDFNWTVDGGTATYYDATGSVDLTAPYKNYVEISWASTGTKTITAVEDPSASPCNGDAVIQFVEVIAEPSATISNAKTTILGLHNVIVSACDGDAALTTADLSIDFSRGNTNEKYPYHFNLSYKVYTVNKLTGAGEIPHTTNNSTEVINTGSADVTDYTTSSSVMVYGSENVTAVPSAANPIIVSSGTEVVADQDYTVQNNKITVYEFTYNNVNAKFSRKSDYIAMRNGNYNATDYEHFTYYPTTAADLRYYIVALPKPQTGPIYHIGNNFTF